MPPATRWFRVRALAALTAIGVALSAISASATPTRPPAPPTLIKQSPTTWLLILATFSNYRPDEVIGELHRRLITHRGCLGQGPSTISVPPQWQRFLLARTAANYFKRQQLSIPTIRLCDQILYALGPESVWALDGVAEKLTDRLGKNHWYWAGRIIRRIGPRAKALVPRLAELLDRPDTVDGPSSDALIIALGAIGPDAAAAVPSLLRFCESSTRYRFDFTQPRSRPVIQTLGKIGPQAAEAGPLLKELTAKDTLRRHHIAVIIAAHQILPDDADIQRRIVETLLSLDLAERSAMAALCIRSAAAMRPQVEARLAVEMQSDDLNARLSAARALAALSAMPSDTLDSLALLGAQDENVSLRAICITVLGERHLATTEARQAIRTASGDSDSLVRAAANRAETLLNH